MCKKLVLLLVCILLSGALTACWDATEIDGWAYVYSIGIDKGVDNAFRFTFQIPTMKTGGGSGKSGSGGGQSGNQEEFVTISVDGPTFYTAVNMIEAGFSRKLNYMHAKYVIIAEDLAREGVEQFINSMVRSRQIRRTMYILISRCKAYEFIENFNPVLTGAISKAQEGFMSTGKNDSGFIIDTIYHHFIKDLKTTYRMPAAPIAAINDFSGFKANGTRPEEFEVGGQYTAGELPRKGGNSFEFFGTALFDGDKMVGELNGIQTRMLLMVRGDYTRASISMADPLNEKYNISIDARQQKKPEIKVSFREGKPLISVKIFLEGDLQNVQNPVEYENVKLKPVLENKFREDIKGYLDETIKICKDLKVDVFGFGEKAVRYFKTIPEWEEYNWLSRFGEAEITTEVDFIIRRTGTILKTNPARDTKGVKK